MARKSGSREERGCCGVTEESAGGEMPDLGAPLRRVVGIADYDKSQVVVLSECKRMYER